MAYIRIIGGWIVVMFAYNLLSSLLRAIGNSAMTLVFLIISSVLNVILDLALVAGAGMGVRGAAAATVIAQGVSAVLCAGYILQKARILIPRRQDFIFEKKLYMELAGKCLFAWLLVPQMGYRAVILCEPLIWCVMALYLAAAFFTNPYIRGKN